MPTFPIWKRMMLKGMKKGQMKGNKKRGKRPRESVETPTPSPTPTPPPTPPPPPSLGVTAPAPEWDFKAARSRWPPEINIRFQDLLNVLVAKGITDENNMLRTEESFKQSWDIDMKFQISYEDYYSTYFDTPPSAKEEGERYLNSAAKNNYFDVPDPKERPDRMYRGFFVIYPDGQDQKDPIFDREPNFTKFVPLISKLGMSAVEYHNFITGSDLQFPVIKKANLFFGHKFQFYFITLEATDNLSGKKATCQSRVVCDVSYNDFKDIEVDLVPIENTFVDSFHRVED